MKSKTLYRDILKKSFNITFKNKILWFFGLFAAPLIGIAEYKIITNSLGGLSGEWFFNKWYPIIRTGIFEPQILRKLLMSGPSALFILFIILATFILFIFFLIWLAIVAQGSLIDAINKSNARTFNSPKLKSSISLGIKNFFPLFGVHFLVKFVLMLSFMLLSLPIIAIAFGGQNTMLEILYFIFSLIFIPIGIVIIFVSKYAINYIIIDKENFYNGIKKGYYLFLNNWLVSIEMSLILFFISIIAGFLVAAIISFLILPFGFLIYIFAQMGLIFILKLFLVLTLILLVILSLLVTSILSTFQYSNWVLLFNKLNSSTEKQHGKLARWFSFGRR
jgi:hypothetical protein